MEDCLDRWEDDGGSACCRNELCREESCSPSRVLILTEEELEDCHDYDDVHLERD